MTDIEKARQIFTSAGLGFPTIPKELAPFFKQKDNWFFSTRETGFHPYNLIQYVNELDNHTVEDYALLCHSGHGVNSYAIQYYLVLKNLAIFLYLGWGGVYMDNQANATQIRECFSLADKLVLTLRGKKISSDRLLIVASDIEDSYWSNQEGIHLVESFNGKGPKEILLKAINWLSTN
jgi:hypothetical protein